MQFSTKEKNESSVNNKRNRFPGLQKFCQLIKMQYKNFNKEKLNIKSVI